MSVHLFVRLSTWNNSIPTGWILIKFNIWIFCYNLSRKFKFHYDQTRIERTQHEDQCTFSITSRSVLLRMKSVSDKLCRGTQIMHFIFNNIFLKIMSFMR
jgi:hypothetical protein